MGLVVVHPANESHIWNDSDAMVAKHVTSDQQSEKPHSTCRMHHLEPISSSAVCRNSFVG
jgi:hypothetical protein